ncbi:MAG: peptide deformylase, partial [Thermodesulfobacteriota bacterium]
MAVLDILIYPDPLLKEVSERVEGFGPETHALVRDLVETMRASPGVGLAAVQIGTPKRIIAVDATPGSPGSGLVVLVNPEITEASGSQRGREGCLS